MEDYNGKKYKIIKSKNLDKPYDFFINEIQNSFLLNGFLIHSRDLFEFSKCNLVFKLFDTIIQDISVELLIKISTVEYHDEDIFVNFSWEFFFPHQYFGQLNKYATYKMQIIPNNNKSIDFPIKIYYTENMENMENIENKEIMENMIKTSYKSPVYSLLDEHKEFTNSIYKISESNINKLLKGFIILNDYQITNIKITVNFKHIDYVGSSELLDFYTKSVELDNIVLGKVYPDYNSNRKMYFIDLHNPKNNIYLYTSNIDEDKKESSIYREYEIIINEPNNANVNATIYPIFENAIGYFGNLARPKYQF